MYAHKCTLIGLRPFNEDEMIVYMNIDGSDAKYAPVNLFCVFDGHGGNAISRFLKKNLYPLVLNKQNCYPLKDEIVHNIFNLLDKQITKIFGSKADYTGSTALVVIHYVKNDGSKHLQVINCGDCRAVLSRRNIGVQLTVDCKPDKFDEYHRITKLGGEITYDGFDHRICGVSVSRAFGDVAAKPYITHKPNIYNYELDVEDRFLVCGCDGVYDVLNCENVNDFVLSHMCLDKNTNKLVPKDKRKNIANLLGQYAIEKGSLDNISIIIVFF